MANFRVDYITYPQMILYTEVIVTSSKEAAQIYIETYRKDVEVLSITEIKDD